jgi:hypothetical protein
MVSEYSHRVNNMCQLVLLVMQSKVDSSRDCALSFAAILNTRGYLALKCWYAGHFNIIYQKALDS